LFMWIRATLPRFRYDQLMRFGWQVLLPAGLVLVLITALLMAFIPVAEVGQSGVEVSLNVTP
jgi:NADH:ubiquinone oxidoreductase subunit H